MIKTAVFAAVVTTGVAVWATGLAAPRWFGLNILPVAEGAAPPVLRPGLRADIQALAVQGLARNASGLTYSDASGTLFGVVNNPPLVIELSTGGKLLRSLPLRGAKDPEGITHMQGDQFILTDEGDQSLHMIHIPEGAGEIVLDGQAVLGLGFGALHNMGFEGVSWDSRKARLYLVQEMLPMRVLTVDGLAGALAAPGLNLRIAEWDLPRLHSMMLADLSSVTLNDATGNLLLLSHMSGVVAEFDTDGRLVGSLSLHAGDSGLTDGIMQAEGLAVDPAGRVFILAEPNLFYRFDRPSGQGA